MLENMKNNLITESSLNYSENSDVREIVARSIIKDLSPLVSPPEVCTKVSQLLQEGNTTSDILADVIIHDPNLTTRLLKLVNSSFFGLSTKVDTVSRAITIVGIDELTSLIYAITSVESFSRIPDELTNMSTFWRHSVYTGLVAKSLATKLNVLQPERLFIAGLLHDIGTLVINARFPELARDIIEDAGGEEEHLYKMEQKLIGFNHATLGALMLEEWKLPKTLCESVQFHHEPMNSKHATMDACILHVSNVLANRSCVGSYCEIISVTDKILPEAINHLKLGEGFEKDVNFEEVEIKFEETMNVLVA